MPPTSDVTGPLTGVSRPVRALLAQRRLHPGAGPFLVPAPGAPTAVNQRLVDAWRAGSLIRIVTGTYLSAAWWSALKPWDRVTVSAAALGLSRPASVFTGATAAHLHGLPLVTTPAELEVRATSRGHRARVPLTPVHQGHHGSREGPPGHEARPLPVPPGIRHRWNVPRSPSDDGPVDVPLRLRDGTLMGSVRADPLCTVQLLTACELPFVEAAAPLDALALRHPAPSSRWAEGNAGAWRSRAGRERFVRAWEFADPRSESAGESFSRALIEELGFVRPRPQHVVHDEHGRFVARVDFWWEEVNVVGEFDGVGKYDIDLHGSEEARRRSIRREAERDRALARLTRRQAHWTWTDLRRPERLAEVLLRAGVPRR